MFWLSANIVRIEAHMAVGTAAALTYAALECRLALESLCYERLRVSYDYVSQQDFVSRWTPKQVIDFLVAEGNDLAAQEFTLSIGRDPVPAATGPVRSEDFDSVEWLRVGKQVGFDVKYIGRIWQALSSFLHVKMPRSKEDEILPYGDQAALLRTLEKAVHELRRLSQGTLVASGLGETVTFVCRCGLTNKRRAKLLSDGSSVNCSNLECNERYRTHVDSAGEFEFERIVVEIACASCGAPSYFAERGVADLGLGKVAKYLCHACGEPNHISWRLMQTPRPVSPDENDGRDVTGRSADD